MESQTLPSGPGIGQGNLAAANAKLEKEMDTNRDQKTPDDSDKTLCSCMHPTHFLGRCQATIEPPEHMCVECMANHFQRADDPAI
jgi:hypothetical protein